METPSFASIDLLADHLDLVSRIGEIRWQEWGHPPEPEALDWWVKVTAQEAGRDGLPITWVAIDALGRAVGAVGLNAFDIEERRDCSPWVIGMIVAEHLRGMGIGSQLLAALEAWAKLCGYSRLWVATGGRAVAFYQKCGWELTETFERTSLEEIAILTKSL